MENANNTEWLGYKVMMHCRPKLNALHNARVPRIVNGEEHIDLSRPHKTILNCGSLEKCYQQIFDEAVEEYNAKQTRKERKITNYLEHVTNDKRRGKHNGKADGARKPAYELIMQLGNRRNRPDDKKAAAILEDFSNFLIEKYPNIRPIGIYLHADEFSMDSATGERIYSPVHIHFDFIFVAHLGNGVKTGPKLQASMSGALKEMGFVTAKGKGTAQQQWEETVRHDLQDFAEKRGFKIDRTPGEKHSHKEKPVYQQMKENEIMQKKIVEQKLEIEREKKIVEKKHNEFVMIKNKIDIYNKINVEVKNQHINFDKETKKLYRKDNEPFLNHVESFVTNVRKLITSITNELIFYKTVFKNFWKKRPQDFRDLAESMERNSCNNFKDYNRKLSNGKLDYQQSQELFNSSSKKKLIDPNYEIKR